MEDRNLSQTYKAFISYSHKDKEWGEWLIKVLEKYRIPRKLVGVNTAVGVIEKSLKPIFRDRDEFAASADLNADIFDALQRSKSLIVICSPNAVDSDYIDAEIRGFKRLGRSDRIFSLVIAGEPNACDADKECLPKALRYDVDPSGLLTSQAASAPIAADARDEGDGKRNALLKLVAGIIGVPFDSLKRRDQQERKKRTIFWMTAAAAIMAVLAGIGLYAIEQRKLRTTLTLVESAQNALARSNLDMAISLSVKAYKNDSKLLETQESLLKTAYFSPGTIRRFIGHVSPVTSVYCSSSGNIALSGAVDGNMILWNLETGEKIRDFAAHKSAVTSVALSPDGGFALSGSADNSVILWDLKTGAKKYVFTGHADDVNAVAFSPDGHFALSGSSDGTMILWDVQRGEDIRHFPQPDSFQLNDLSFEGLQKDRVSNGILDRLRSIDMRRFYSEDEILHEISRKLGNDKALHYKEQILKYARVKEVTAVGFERDGQRILSGVRDGHLRLWNANTGKVICYFPDFFHPDQRHHYGVSALDISDDGKIAIAGPSHFKLIEWDVEKCRQIRLFPSDETKAGHTNFPTSVAISPDNRTALSGSIDTHLILWDLGTGKEIRRFSDHTKEITSVTFCSDNRTGLSASADMTLRLWDLYGHGSELQRFDKPTDQGVAFNPLGDVALLSAHNNGSLFLWHLGSNKVIKELKGHAEQVLSIAFSKNGDYAISGSRDSSVIIWNTKSWNIVRRFMAHKNAINSVALSPSGRLAASASYSDPSLKIWYSDTGEILNEVEEKIYSVSFSPDGQTFLASASDGTIYLRQVDSKEIVQRFKGHTGTVYSVAFSPDGSHVISGSEDRTVRVWSTRTGAQVREPLKHQAAVGSVVYHPQGHYILSGTTDIHLWDLETGREISAFTGHQKGVRNLAFSPDGRIFLSTSYDWTTRVWQFPPIDDLEKWVSDNRYVP